MYVCDVSGVYIGLNDLKSMGIIPHDWLSEYSYQVSAIDSSDSYLNNKLYNMIRNEFKSVFEMDLDGKLKTLSGPDAKIHFKQGIEIMPYACMKSREIPLHAKESVQKDIDQYKSFS